MRTEIEQRVRRLEWMNRGLIVLVGLFVVVGAARPEPKELRLQSLVIEDEKGASLISLGTTTPKDGVSEGIMNFTNAAGLDLISFGSIQQMPYVELRGPFGSGRIRASVGEKKSSVDLTDTHDQSRIGLHFSDEASNLVLKNSFDETGLSLRFDEGGFAHLGVTNGSDKAGVDLLADRKGVYGLMVSDPEGKRLFKKP